MVDNMDLKYCWLCSRIFHN